MEPRRDPAYSNPFAAPQSDANYFGHRADVSDANLAERGTRLAGSILDGLLYALTLIPGVVVVAITEGESALGWALMALMFLGYWVQQMIQISTTGQSLAKKWLNMKIVKVDGTPVDFVSGVLLRSWVMGLLNQIPFVALIDAVMIFADDRQCLHDKLAGTKVIDVSNWNS